MKTAAILFIVVSFILPAFQAQAAGPSIQPGSVVITGRDLGISTGTGLLLFGDTTHETVVHGGPHACDRSATAAYFTGSRANPAFGDAQLTRFPGTPTGAITTDAIYAWYMANYRNDGHKFYTSSSGVARSTDGGRSWQAVKLANGPTWYNQMTPYSVPMGGYVYLLATESGRMAPARLVRVPVNSIMNPASYRYFTGSEWTADSAQGNPVLPGTVGELSISYNTAYGQYLALYMSPSVGGMVYSMAPQITGPWSAPVLFAPWGAGPDSSPWYGTYAPQTISPRNGRVIPILYSHFDDYTVRLTTLTLP